MDYESCKKLAQRAEHTGRRYLTTAYFFLVLSAVFFGVFFTAVPELTLAGCAFLCDAAAVVYLVRAIKQLTPFRQGLLALRCAGEPTGENLAGLAAALESTAKPVKYSAAACARFRRAYEACLGDGALTPEKERQLEVLRRAAQGKPVADAPARR